MPTIQVPEDARKYGFDSYRASGAAHLNEEIYFSRDGTLRGIPYEKPADTQLEAVLHLNVDPDALGPVIKLGKVLASDSLADGYIAAGYPVIAYDGTKGSKLVLTTSGGASTDKVAMPIVSPAEVGG